MRAIREILKPDWFLILFYFLFIILGWITIYSVSLFQGENEIFNFSTRYGKQMIWIGISILIALFLLLLDSNFYETITFYVYLFSLILLIGLFLFGEKINGATSWYTIGNVSFQPTEFSKVATLLAITKIFNENQFSFKKLKYRIQIFVILLLPMILISLQPDIGSVVVYFSFIFLFYREGLHSNVIIILALSFIFFITTLVFGYKYVIGIIYLITTLILWYVSRKRRNILRFQWPKILVFLGITTLYVYSVYILFHYVFKQRHRDRFNVLLGLTGDTNNIGYNSYQSIKTISSGGFLGKGYLQGDRTRGKFVPEQDTDYIFTAIAEEWGFLGASFIILIFTIFILRILYLSEKQKSKFSRVYGYGVACILFFHVLINIAMVIGLFPVIGIPLPFFSYGGSSLCAFTILIFIFIKLDSTKGDEL